MPKLSSILTYHVIRYIILKDSYIYAIFIFLFFTIIVIVTIVFIIFVIFPINHSGAVKADTVMTLDGKQAKTVNGADVTIKILADGGVKIDSANVVSTDIMCDNGVIHVIDNVLLPALAQPKEKKEEDLTKAEIEAKYNTGRKLSKVRLLLSLLSTLSLSS